MARLATCWPCACAELHTTAVGMASVSHKISVEVETAYLEDQSEPRERRYVFSYTITIRNEGEVPAKLLTRHWVITDANGRVQRSEEHTSELQSLRHLAC